MTKQAQVAEPRSLIFTGHFIVQSNHQPSTVAIATVVSVSQLRKPKKHDNAEEYPAVCQILSLSLVSSLLNVEDG